MNRSIIFGSLALFALLCLVLGGSFWLQKKVEQQLTTQITDSINAEIHFEEVWLNLFAGRLEARKGIARSLEEEKLWGLLRVEKISAKFSWKDLFSSLTPVQIELDQVHLVMQNPNLSSTPPATLPTKNLESPKKTLWPRVEVREVMIKDLSLTDSELSLSITGAKGRLTRRAVDNTWNGTFELSSLSLLQHSFNSCQLALTFSDQKLLIDSYSFKAEQGKIYGHASFPMAVAEPWNIDFHLDQVPLTMLIPSQWQIFLQGLASGSGNCRIANKKWSEAEVKGQLSLAEARLQSLPVLEKLSLLFGSTDAGLIKLDQASTDFYYARKTTTLNRFAVTKKNIFSWQGTLVFGQDGALSGTTMLGISSDAASLVPSLREKIFNTEQDNYAWTMVKLTGTSKKIDEDLSPRLLALAEESGMKGLTHGKNFLNQALEKTEEYIKNFLKSE
jgi:hypothetical protein